MSKRLILSSLLLLAACETRPVAATPITTTQAALTAPATLRSLIDKTPLVAHVKVIKSTGRSGTMGTQQTDAIFTELTLQVLGPIHGNADSITITTIGGQLGERAMHVSGQVELSEGDEAIVFLDPAIALHPFVGGQGGALPVKDGRVFSSDGRALLEVRAEGFVFAGRPSQSPALEPKGTATAKRVAAPDGPALTVAEVIAASRALP